jgi:hypothetical protein
MSPLMTKLLTGVLRVWLAPILSWLVDQSVLSEHETTELIGQIVAWGGPAVWAAYAWWQAHHETEDVRRNLLR